MDGRVLSEAFSEVFRLKNPVEYSDEAPDPGSDEEFSYSVEESLEVTERLRSLGYIE